MFSVGSPLLSYVVYRYFVVVVMFILLTACYSLPNSQLCHSRCMCCSVLHGFMHVLRRVAIILWSIHSKY